ncbi:glycosyltransferase family 59 protein [Xylariomycetidae sp. FL2044]|nr:glycosyltransferase family 59 protein [Xylariomycetidae sp. FL2044]
MSSLRVLDSSFTPQALRYGLVAAATHIFSRGSIYPISPRNTLAILTSVNILGRIWLSFVSRYAPEPYLDEVFHIPQAQVYCEGRYSEWDDKITTPPGLYALTLLWNRLSGLSCSPHDLRVFNVEVLSYLAVVAALCRARIERLLAKHYELRPSLRYALATGTNVALFPVLFFFSALYYTDVVSTLVVLLAFADHLERSKPGTTSVLGDLYTVVLGLLALCMRQTNIFWVVIFMGGLEVIGSVKSLKHEPVKTPRFTTLSAHAKFNLWRYSLGDIHDPSLSITFPVDVALCIISIGVAAACNIGIVLRRFIWPHGFVLAAFVAFVVWNGGVVLGDKSNHVATLHLAQLLYIWPLFSFFSAPLFIPQLLGLLRLLYQRLVSSSASRPSHPSAGAQSDHPETGLKEQSSALKVFNSFSASHLLHSILLVLGALASATLIVHFNTIIHPFTLADNRHYMFYVFRYSILRAWWVRYALIPIYVACGWLCWRTLQGSQVLLSQPSETPASGPPSSLGAETRKTVDGDPGEGKSASPLTLTTLPSDPSTTAPPVSMVLMLLLSTALSLMTAPLVEPRYFILPWVFWRLLIPAPTSFSSSSSPSSISPEQDSHRNRPGQTSKPNKAQPSTVSGSEKGPYVTSVQALETLWFLLINLATMYIFISRPFYWYEPDGTPADGGRAQRFMW